MESTFDEMVEQMEAMKADAAKFFDSGNKAAGKRLRKAAMDLKKSAHELRKEISEEISSM